MPCRSPRHCWSVAGFAILPDDGQVSKSKQPKRDLVPDLFLSGETEHPRDRQLAGSVSPRTDTPNDFYMKDAQVVSDLLQTDLHAGLTTAQAQERLHDYGFNELQEMPRPSLWQMFLAQFRDFVVIILIVAAAIALLLGETVDALAIAAIVVINAVIGVVQEAKAENALRALQKMSAPNARALRDGIPQVVPARELVPGDVVLLEAGNYVPADMRLVEAVNLRIDEASLTGESVPADKRAEVVLSTDAPLGDRKNMAYMGTMVTYGRGKGIVTTTAMHTEIGLIAKMLQAFGEEETPLQRKLGQLGAILGMMALAVCVLVFAIGVLRDTSFSIFGDQTGTLFSDALAYVGAFRFDLLNLFMTAVSLAIAAVPEGLPAVVTITLALGMQRMVRRHVLLRKLKAVETLGSTTVICSDKTGTLTQNEMMVTSIYVNGRTYQVTGTGYEPVGTFQNDGSAIDPLADETMTILLETAALCNDAQLLVQGDNTWRMVGDPTEGALVVAAAKAKLTRDVLAILYPRQAEIPFDGDRKRMTTIHKVWDVENRLRIADYGLQTLAYWPGTTGGALTIADDGLPATDYGLQKTLSELPKAEDGPLSADRAIPVSSIVRFSSPYVVFVKGAAGTVLGLCASVQENGRVRAITEADRNRILSAHDSMAGQALRVLGMAYRPLEAVPEDLDQAESDLIFVGLAGMIDAARPEVKDAVAICRQAGIRAVMITGDARLTAIAIGKELDFLGDKDEVLTGQELDNLSDQQLVEKAKNTTVYARVSPHHKVRIVEALKEQGEIVAMTGDGVNDAPALKRADIGVAMGITGTDVSKETSDMVLTDDNFASIVAAVEEGRIIYNNIRKFVYYLLSCNIAEILIIFLAQLMGLPLPLRPIQLLWLNLLTDGLPALSLALEKGDPDVMQRKPRDPGEPVINRSMWIGMAVQAVTVTTAVLSAFIYGLHHFAGLQGDGQIIAAQTMAFVVLNCAELIVVYAFRSEHFSVFKIGFFSNPATVGATLLSFVLLLAVVYVPFLDPIFYTVELPLREWLVMVPLMVLPFLAAEATKLVQWRGVRPAATAKVG